jgi:hypothetical protein
MTGRAEALGQVVSDLQEMRLAADLWQHAILSSGQTRSAQAEPISAKLIKLVHATAVRSLDTLRDCAGSGDEQRAVAAMVRDALQFTEWAAEAQLALALMAEMDARPYAGPWCAASVPA